MIEIIKAKKPASPEIGDYLFGRKYLRDKPTELLKTCNLIHLSHFARLPWQAMSRAGIGNISISGFIKASLNKDDPYRNRVYFTGIVPDTLLTNDASVYDFSKVREPKMATDLEWNRGVVYRSYLEDNDTEPTETAVTRTYMGSGYTSGTMPYDGHAGLGWGYVDLSNGDALRCIVWEWYNK